MAKAGVVKICSDCGCETFYASKGLCKKCYRKAAYKRETSTPEARQKIKETRARHYQKHKEYYKKRSKDYNENNTGKVIEYRKKYYERTHEEQKAKSREYYHRDLDKSRAKNRERSVMPATRFRQGIEAARKRELVWDLTFEQYSEIISKPCHYCGKDLTDQKGSSLDRIDNNLGYTLGNVLPCCGDCNVVKNDVLTVQEMEIAMKAVLEFRKSTRLVLVGGN